ncbi:OX-2 membrane glycoprotein-like isoform X2 [Pseudophryne corroboree]|uniref:OX-2 membrane glycoprotein-like isoform X2 n=1 Tax=Pseudophryne corroboree TaxID=495146 RepID=UPI0030819039
MGWKEAYFGAVCMLCSAVIGADASVKAKDDLVEFGESATLECTLSEAKEIIQATWTKTSGNKETTVATITRKSGALITKGYENRLNVSLAGVNKTAITVYRASIDDEGCYTCVLNVFPIGASKGKPCLSFIGPVLIEKHHNVRLGEAVTLKCLLQGKYDVKQVSWQKDGRNVATYYTGKQTFIFPEYENVYNMTMAGLNVTAITIRTSKVSDEGDYQCIFNSYPSGSSTGKTTLHIYEPLNVALSKDHWNDFLNITCVARARPLPVISWSGVGGGYTNGSSSDGLVTVTSWIVIKAADSQLSDTMQCRVLHAGKETAHKVSEIKNCSVSGMAFGCWLSNVLPFLY